MVRNFGFKSFLLAGSIGFAALAAAPAMAEGQWPTGPQQPCVNVPEIDAGSGLAAMAAVFGALAFVRERRRQA